MEEIQEADLEIRKNIIRIFMREMPTEILIGVGVEMSSQISEELLSGDSNINSGYIVLGLVIDELNSRQG